MQRALLTVAILLVPLGACVSAPPAVAERTETPTPAPPSPVAPVITATPTPIATPAVAPPAGPDALRCTERVALPEIADVITAAWSPDGATLALSHTVPLPSARITGSPEDFFLDALDLRTGALTPLGLGERQQWSASGKYLSYWSFDGELRIAIGGRVLALPQATIPDVRWVGDTLFFIAKDELRSWHDGDEQLVARLPAPLEPHYPADDASFSGDAERFTITRYSLDGVTRRYIGVTRTGAVSALDVPEATYTEWGPSGATLLVRYAGRAELRGADGALIRAADLARFPGPVHGWTPDGRDPLFGQVTPALAGSVAFDDFARWSPAGVEATATLPNLLGGRQFSPDGAFFSGDSRTGLTRTRFELYRCGTRLGIAAATAAPRPAEADQRRYVRPVVGAITQVIRGTHTGIDVAAPLGALILAADDGVVTAVGWVNVGGRRVCVGHASGIVTCDYHTSAALVTVGQRVERGQPVALIGLTGVTTGPHVHWEATLGDRIIDPLTR